ncbi:MAG: TetR/AcrR family transcriptional regulator [Nitriliruptoraceae bacterium]|nr:TetR/AcrR family transcriptional regulator [Nitriliruptoraceae bacterium]
MAERSAGEGRRERLRRETWRDLRAAALAEVRDVGAAGLSLRSVARRLGMSPAGLYRYVDSREALLTVLIADGYHDLADHLVVALGAGADELRAEERAAPQVPVVAPPDAGTTARLEAVGLAYRAWGVSHPNEFGLLFGDPIPGYAAPEGGVTVEAMRRVGIAFAQPILELHAAGELALHPALGAREIVGQMGPMVDLGASMPAEVAALLLLAWGRLHGQVSLEVFGQHHWLMPDGCEALYRAELARMLVELRAVPEPAT